MGRIKRAQNFDFIQDTLSVFLFLERGTRRRIFQKMRKTKSMQKEREKGQKTIQKNCFCRAITLLLDSKNDAFS